jgi:hypothetical protein
MFTNFNYLISTDIISAEQTTSPGTQPYGDPCLWSKPSLLNQYFGINLLLMYQNDFKFILGPLIARSVWSNAHLGQRACSAKRDPTMNDAVRAPIF